MVVQSHCRNDAHRSDSVRTTPVRFPSKEIPELFEVSATTDYGMMPLKDYLHLPEAGARAFIVVKSGVVVAEAYPDLGKTDPHLWASCAKPTASLMIEHLIEAGQIDETRTIGTYLPTLNASAWRDVTVRDALDMTPGLDCEENDETRADPSSNAIRAFLAEFGEPFGDKTETLLEVLQTSKRVRPAGQKFEYGSPCTQVLVLLAEAVSGRPWSKLFQDNVWAHVHADAPLLMHLTPDGVALAHGVVSSRLRDMARFGMLYTPSWPLIATKQVVSIETVKRIQNVTRDRSFFDEGYDGPVFKDRLGDDTMLGASRQWDCVWPDGDMFKFGFMDQGLYVSPSRDVVIAYFSTTTNMQMARYLRPLATSEYLA